MSTDQKSKKAVIAKNHEASQSKYRTYKDRGLAFRKRHPRIILIVLVLIAALPALYFYYGYFVGLFTHFKGGDFDQQAQYYEAARISILHFHQFPFWNPWESGGMPLYNNPQYGLLSIQSFTTLIFGTFAGLKIAYLCYVAIGFAGIYKLSRAFGATMVRAILLSYIWIFCGFFSYHGIDHLGFSLLHFLPWLVLIYMQKERRHSWLWFGLILGTMLLTSPHYAVLMCAFVIAILWIWESFFTQRQASKAILGITFEWHTVMFFVKAGFVALILAGYRLIGAYNFIKSAPRSPMDLNDPNTSPLTTLEALFAPVDKIGYTTNIHWGWGEYSGYVGFGMTLAFGLLLGTTVFLLVRNIRLHRITTTRVIRLLGNHKLLAAIIFLGLLGYVLAIGNFSPYSPNSLLRHLPGFDQTRVAARWILLSVFALIVSFSVWKRYPTVTNLLLAFAVLELVSLFHIRPNYFSAETDASHLYNASFTQVTNPRYDRLMGSGVGFDDETLDSLYVNTIQNRGSVYTADPLLNTTVSAPTIRCGGRTSGTCPFIQSQNAKIVSWTPNKIILQRTNDKPISIDMNPGSYWLINDQRLPNYITPADSDDPFVITDKSKTITLEIIPPLSVQNALRIL